MAAEAKEDDAWTYEQTKPLLVDREGRTLRISVRITGGSARIIGAFWHFAASVRTIKLLHDAEASADGAVTIHCDLCESGDGAAITPEPSLSFREDALVVVERGHCIQLRRAEFSLLRYLAERQGRWVPSAELRHVVLGYSRPGDSAVVRNHVHALRRKLRASFIESRRALGYRFVE